MKAIEFQANLNADDSLGVPKEVASQLPREKKLQVIVLVPDTAETDEADDSDWPAIAREQFLAGYSDGDSIYDSL
ncbi:MAG: hypothetical protein WD733_24150 [Bryobacterales bacterium]